MKKETALNLAGTGLSKSVSNLTKSLRQRQALAKKLSKVPYGGIKKNESLLTRLNIEQNMREQEEIELDYYINYITRQKERKLYEVEDVQKELEDLTEDEEEIKQRSPRTFEIWGIKKDKKKEGSKKEKKESKKESESNVS